MTGLSAGDHHVLQRVGSQEQIDQTLSRNSDGQVNSGCSTFQDKGQSGEGHKHLVN